MTSPDEKTLAVGVRRAAEMSGLSQSGIRRAIARGELPAIRRGDRVLVMVDDLLAWLRRGYDDQRARSQRGQHLPPGEGRASGGPGHDAGREAPVPLLPPQAPPERPRLSRVEGQPRRAPATQRPRSTKRRAHLDPWDLPDRMAS